MILRLSAIFLSRTNGKILYVLVGPTVSEKKIHEGKNPQPKMVFFSIQIKIFSLLNRTEASCLEHY